MKKLETLKSYLVEYVNEITEKSKSGLYICPLCGSGTGKHKTGAFGIIPSSNGTAWKCHACGNGGTIIDLYAKIHGVDSKKAIKQLLRKYNLSISSSSTINTKKEDSNAMPKDYTKFFRMAQQHLHQTEYLTKRGLSVGTQQYFGCGYVANFMYKGNQTTPAVIIPTSNSSFMWRSTVKDIKQKRGVTHILNPSALQQQQYCFVVEGEIDCMSVFECGFNAIGLGSASNIKKIFDYDIIPSTVLIIALDNDQRGRKATNDLKKICEQREIAYIIASNRIWYGYKDANELLIHNRNILIQQLNKEVSRAIAFDYNQYLEDLREKKKNAKWQESLKCRVDGFAKNTLNNINLVLCNDERYRNKIEFNEFTQLITYEKENWTDVRESYLKLHLEQSYDLIASIDNINHACNINADIHKYHPVRDYLNSLRWDGTERVSTVFTDFLGASDNIYTRAVAVISFVGAVARVFKPGIKFDTCTVFVGRQGIGKSKFLSKIAVNSDWFTDSVISFEGKEFYESIQGKWIVELGEGTAFQKSIKERSKQAITSQQDYYRLPYARHPEIKKRQCVFFGTTNNYDFLKDETGDRRYYPIDVDIRQATKNIDYDLTPEYVAQLWAEAVLLFQNRQSIYIQDERVLAIAEQEQRNHFDESPLQSDIYNFLEIPIPEPEKWYSMSLDSRQRYIQAYQNGEDTYKALRIAGCYKRDRISVKEIMCELYGYELNQPIERKMSLDVARSLTALGWHKNGQVLKIRPYGNVRIFIK